MNLDIGYIIQNAPWFIAMILMFIAGVVYKTKKPILTSSTAGVVLNAERIMEHKLQDKVFHVVHSATDKNETLLVVNYKDDSKDILRTLIVPLVEKNLADIKNCNPENEFKLFVQNGVIRDITKVT